MSDNLFATVTVVTSFNADGYEQYGRRMVETFDELWPKEARLLVYYQGEFARRHSQRITWIDLDKTADINTFKKKFGNFNQANGIMITKGSGNSLVAVHDYRYDAIRFCHKVFSILDSMNHSGRRYLVWIDGDTFTKVVPTESWLKGLLPENGKFHTYIKRRNDCSEAGFLAYDVTHVLCPAYFTKLHGLWMSGDIFAHREWHDSFIFDRLRETYAEEAFRSISVGGSGTVHPFVNCSLGLVMDHVKGPVRKITGTSAGTERHNPNHQQIMAPMGGRYGQIPLVIARVKPRSIIEVGTWNGARAKSMILEALNHVDYVHYTGYDLFEDATQQTDVEEKNVKPHFHVETVRAMLSGLRETLGGRFDFTLHKGNSNKTLVPGTTADFVFIDGGHSVATIQHDFDCLKDSKCIVLDDYYAGGIDTSLYGCNKVVELVDHVVLQQADLVSGGGTVQFVVVEKDS